MKTYPIELHNIQHVTFTPDKINIIRNTKERDPILYTVYHRTLNRWPEQFQEAPCIGCQFWGARDELIIDNGLLLTGDRVCISPELYQRMLSELHNGHKGIEKMKTFSRERIYWQGIEANIIEYVKYCQICTKYTATQAIQLMLPRVHTRRPLARSCSRLFHHHNTTEYLPIADTFCKYPFLYKISSKAAEPITQAIKALISQNRPPKRL